MIGRAAYDNPYLFATVDRDIFGENTLPPTPEQVVNNMLPYIDYWTEKGLKLHSISRHILQLFAGKPGTKAWKRHISENAHLPDANSTVIKDALVKVISHQLMVK